MHSELVHYWVKLPTPYGNVILQVQTDLMRCKHFPS